MSKKIIHYKDVLEKYNIKEEGILTPNKKICKCGETFSRKLLKCPKCGKKLRNKDCHIIERIQRYDYKEDLKKLTYNGYEVLFDEVESELYEKIVLKFEFNKLTGKINIIRNKFHIFNSISYCRLDWFFKDNGLLGLFYIKNNEYEKKEVLNQLLSFLYQRFYNHIDFKTLVKKNIGVNIDLELFLYIFYNYRGIFNSISLFLSNCILFYCNETLIEISKLLNDYFPDIDFNDSKNESQFLLLKFLCTYNEKQTLNDLDKLCILIKNYPQETERLGVIFDEILASNNELDNCLNKLLKMLFDEKITLQQMINLYKNMKLDNFVRIGDYYDNYVDFYHSTPNLDNNINKKDMQRMQQKLVLSKNYSTTKIEKAYSLINKSPVKALEYLISD